MYVVNGSWNPNESKNIVLKGPIPPIIESIVITPSCSHGEEGGIIV